ncbi:MAG TPA: serine/threonine-protein kinase [Kofleriaceae bacterium]|nr:serine/threonine-protein kinase [Kofleriaceae bacterium]
MTTQQQAGPVLSVGSVVADTYRVTRLLGRGGMGAVWEAIHLRLPGKKVAIKVLHADIAGDQEALARFRREAEIASRLGHPNIVEVHDFNSLPGGQPYLVLELLVGESLDSRMRRAPVSLDNAMRIAGQIGAALSAAHRQSVVHRDLKPQNVFLCRRGDDGEGEGGGEVVKVLDFGISKVRGSQTIKTLDSTILGTPQYMAPEQATGNHAAVDQRTDVFALGAIVYEMLAGRPAFSGQSVPEVVFKVVYEAPAPLAGLVPGVPRRVAEAVDRALAKVQDERFPDVVSFVEQMAGVSISTLRRSPLAPAPAAPVEADPADPLAHTVDSSRRELAPAIQSPAEAAAELAAEGAPAHPSAEAAGPVEPRSQAATDPRARPRVRRNTARLMAAIAVAAAAMGSLAIALGTRSSDRDAAVSAQATSPRAAAAGQTPATGPAPGTSSAAPPPGTPSPGPPADAKTPVAEPPGTQPPGTQPPGTPTAGAKTPGTESPGKTPRRQRPRPDPDGDAESAEPSGSVRDELIDGERALRAADYRRALVMAERALRHGAGPAAHALRARASCAIGDLGNARASFSRIGRRPFLRRQVLAFCTRSGLDLGP